MGHGAERLARLLQQMNLNLEMGLLSEFLVGQGSNDLSDVKRREESS